MKKVLIIAALLIIAAIGANILMKGGFPFMQSMSEEEQQINRLRKELHAAEQEYRQAGRASGLTGVDSTAGAGAALAEVERIERDLAMLQKELTSEAAKMAARRLQDEIDDLKMEMR
jgi:hypothetical protein